MRTALRTILAFSVLLIPALLFLGGSAGSGDSDPGAEGSRAVTFYVA